ncbi:MAG: alpha/beta fold hydrolase [Candidatus Solibacter usitatus]|nr:alpha/beta fold hydrolase [Candidatus Solibacter usitatus]
MIWLILLPVVLLVAGLAYQWAGARRDEARYPPPGRIVNGFHVRVAGVGAPVVVLESGIAASSVSWRLVQESLARRATVLSYDRAGFGWSRAAATPRTVANLVAELRAVISASGLAGPFVFVGHSFGGLLLRHYAARFPADVAGLVLVDPLEPMEWHPASAEQRYRLGKGVMLARRGATLARLGIVRLAVELLLAGSRLLPQILSKASSGRGSSVTDRLVGELSKLPPDLWPVMKSHWCLPRSFRTLAEYLERLPEACALPLEDAVLRDVPVVVISAGKTSAEVREGHRRTAGASARGVHVIAGGSGHWVQLDRPEIIVDAVLKVAGGAGPLH